MNRRTFMKSMPALAMLAGPVVARSAETSSAANAPTGSTKDLQPITLPKHETDGGKSVTAEYDIPVATTISVSVEDWAGNTVTQVIIN